MLAIFSATSTATAACFALKTSAGIFGGDKLSGYLDRSYKLSEPVLSPIEEIFLDSETSSASCSVLILLLPARSI
jgi:hypothetical protein